MTVTVERNTPDEPGWADAYALVEAHYDWLISKPDVTSVTLAPTTTGTGEQLPFLVSLVVMPHYRGTVPVADGQVLEAAAGTAGAEAVLRGAGFPQTARSALLVTEVLRVFGCAPEGWERDFRYDLETGRGAAGVGPPVLEQTAEGAVLRLKRRVHASGGGRPSSRGGRARPKSEVLEVHFDAEARFRFVVPEG